MITCPRCGASNPQDHRFCGQCGHLLQDAPATPAAASDLPAWLSDVGLPDAPSPAADAATPDWLAQLQQETKPSPAAADELPAWLRDDLQSEANASPLAAPTSQPTSELPDWLREVEAEAAASARPSAPQTASDELPPWLRDDADASQPSPSTPASQAGSSELPDWLREVEAEAAAPASAPTNQVAADELPPWLRDETTASSPAPAAPLPAANELPDWLREVEAEVSQPAPSAPTSQATPDELPPWLRDDESASSSAATTPLPAAGELPDWLREVEAEVSAPANQIQQTKSSAQDLPDWLREDQPTATAQATPPSAPDQLDVAVPDWLAFDAPAQSEPPHSAATDPGATQSLDVPLPDWSSEFGAPTEHEAPQQEADELPAWLRESSPTASAAAPDVPNWLQADTSAASYETQPLANISPANQSASAADDLPPWLAADSAANTPAEARPGDATTQALPAWLLDQPEATSETTPRPSSSAANDDLPSWLQSVDEPAPAPTAEGIPSWLGVADEPSAAKTYDAPSGSDLPAWLADDTTDAPSAAKTYDAPAGSGLPSWLADDTTDAPSTTTSYDAPAGSDLPAWLSDQSSDAPSATTNYDAPSGSDLPSWLADESSDAPSAARIYDTPKPAAPAAGSADTVQLPAWLAEAEQPNSPSSAASTTDADLPPWLSGIAAEEPSPPAQNNASTLPSWLEDPDQPSPQQPAAAAPQSEFLGGLELPAWLRAEQETDAAKQPVTEPAPSWLQRGATEGDEPTAVVAMPETGPAPRIVRSPERIAAMQLLDQLVTSPAAEPLPQTAPRRRSLWLPILIALVLLVLVGAILFIIFNQRLGLNFGAAPVPVPAASAVTQTIAALPANKPVVLAYDWDAQRLGELGALEDAVIGQLVERTDVPLVLVSTDPQGALLAGERSTQLLTIKDGFHDQYGLGLVNLGFKAGGPIALHRFADNAAFGDLFAQDAFGYDLRSDPVTMPSFCGAETSAACAWDDVSMLVVMADEVEDVRGWVEQVRSVHPALPTLLLTTAEIGPQVQPYATTPNTYALSGMQAAEAYNQSRGIQDERLGRQIDATAVGSATFAALVLVGALPAYITGRRQRQAAEDESWTR